MNIEDLISTPDPLYADGSPYAICDFWYSQTMDNLIGHSSIELDGHIVAYTILKPVVAKSATDEPKKPDGPYNDFEFKGRGEFVNSIPHWK